MITDFSEVFDKDILKSSNLMSYVRAETVTVISRSGIWSLSLLNLAINSRRVSFYHWRNCMREAAIFLMGLLLAKKANNLLAKFENEALRLRTNP